MQKIFTKILVPVAFNRNTRWSVDKAVQLANRFDCDIVLLHVQPPAAALPFMYNSFFLSSFIKTSEKDLDKKMKELEQQCMPKLKEGLLMTSLNLLGNWQSTLKDVIISEHIDLVMIPQSRRRTGSALIRKININKLSQQANCPVITVTRHFNVNHLQNIVVPVHDLLPLKKLTIATYLSLATSGRIYLMGGDSHETAKADDGNLIRAYQLLNDVGKLNIHCAMRNDNDAAASTLAYAKGVKADLIVVNPGQESRLRGWWNKLRGKYLNRESDIPVLTVAF